MTKSIRQFEEKIQKALKFKYKNEPPKIHQHLISNNVLMRWDLLKFYNLYTKSKIYPKTRIKKIIYYLFDIKIQLYYLLEIDFGLYNRLIYNLGYDNKNIRNFPHIQLIKFSLDQNAISKSRILWERIMNWIYYLETGNKLEDKVTGRKSKKDVFFKFIEGNKWKFLMSYKKYIDWFDEKLRTPEFHKSSILRKHFLEDSDVDPDKISGIINIVMNAIWENCLNIIQGEKPMSRYWNIAMRINSDAGSSEIKRP